MITQTLFISSFVGIAIMLGSKLAEERFGKFHWWSKIAAWADQKVHSAIHIIVEKYKFYKKVVSIFVFEFLPAYAYRKLIELKDYVYKKYYSSANNLKGEKRMLRSNGTVSEFLKNISKEGKPDVPEEKEMNPDA